MAPGGLAKKGDVGRVASERDDIAFHPGQRCYLIHQPIVDERFIGFRRFGKRRMSEEAKCAQAVVQSDQHHTVVGERRPVVGAKRARSRGVAAAM